MNIDIKTRENKIQQLYEKYPIFGDIRIINSLIGNVLSEETSDEKAYEDLNNIENYLKDWSNKIKIIDRLSEEIAKNFIKSTNNELIKNKK